MRQSWAPILAGSAAKEIEFARILDEPSYIVRTSPEEKALVGWPDGGHQPYFVSRDPEVRGLRGVCKNDEDQPGIA